MNLTVKNEMNPVQCQKKLHIICERDSQLIFRQSLVLDGLDSRNELDKINNTTENNQEAPLSLRVR